MRTLQGFGVIEHLILEGDKMARNTEQQPNAVVPHARGDATLESGTLRATLPPLSWNVIRLAQQST